MLLKNIVFITEMQKKLKDSQYSDTGRLTVNGQVVALHDTHSIRNTYIRMYVRMCFIPPPFDKGNLLYVYFRCPEIPHTTLCVSCVYI